MKRRTEILLIVGILAVAAFFRLWHLDTTPPGLYPDEAMNGNNALEALATGNFQVFYPENNGREGLFIALQAVSIHFFGNTAWALRVVSAIAGILTVLGVYLLSKRLFDSPHIAAFSSFLMAIGFWHVLFSRIGFRAIMAPLIAVWAFYFFWRGLDTNRLWTFGMSGILWGLGMYTYIAFRIMPLALLAVWLVHWYSVRRDFSHDKYLFTRRMLVSGFVFLIGLACLTALPLAWHFAVTPGDFLGRTAQVSIFSSDYPLVTLSINIVKTLGMFVVSGDYNWRHNISGEPVLFWPIAALFVVGFARSIFKIGRTLRSHGHPSAVQTLLVSWFVVGLLPSVLSSEGIPHALRAIMVAPPVYIFAGEALWWVYQWCMRWYNVRDQHQWCLPAFIHNKNGGAVCAPAGAVVVTTTFLIFLGSLAVAEYYRYFVQWGQAQATADAFAQPYVDVARRIQMLPPSTVKYVVVNAPGVDVRGVPMPAQTVMYLTDTWTPEKQAAHHIFYLSPEQYARTKYAPHAAVFKLQQ